MQFVMRWRLREQPVQTWVGPKSNLDVAQGGSWHRITSWTLESPRSYWKNNPQPGKNNECLLHIQQILIYVVGEQPGQECFWKLSMWFFYAAQFKQVLREDLLK